LFSLEVLVPGSTTAKIIGNNLTLLLTARKISKSELSENVGISRPGIDGLLNATANPQIDTLGRLAKFFDVSIFDLVNPEFPVVGSKKSRLELIQAMSFAEAIREINSRLSEMESKILGIPVGLLDKLAGLDSTAFDAIDKVLQSLDRHELNERAKKKASRKS
jgi:transcriptional regulator with XRE-family HTH domain